MTSNVARKVLGSWAGLGLVAALGPVPPALGVDFGGSFGFGLTARKQAGDFGWDFDSAREETTLVDLKFGARPAGLDVFLSLGAGLDESRGDGEPSFLLREASVRYGWRSAGGDSLDARLFVRQPNNFWFDTPFAAAVAAREDDAQGARIDARAGHATAALVVADRSDFAASGSAAGEGSFVGGRLRADVWDDARLRAGTTWTRSFPERAFQDGAAATREAGWRDVVAFDLRSAWRGVQASLEYGEAHADLDPAARALQEPGRRPGWRGHRSRRLTDILPTHAVLRAELRAPGLDAGRWGRLGFAPAYRAVGAHHDARLAAPERDFGSPRRGLEGYRLEAWYSATGWPVWVRQVYDRHVQFRDADRRVILQVSEADARLTEALRARARYVQRDVREGGVDRSARQDGVQLDLVAEDRLARLRVQVAMQDLNTPAERELAAFEVSARVAGRLQALGRLAFASEGPAVRRSVFAALQYWHLPQFEMMLQYGPEWIGDTADPALDADLLADGEMRDVVRLHFRGWF